MYVLQHVSLQCVSCYVRTAACFNAPRLERNDVMYVKDIFQ